MSFLPKTLLAGALAAGALALPVTTAHAATYCAYNAGFTCPAGSIKVGTDLQKALTQASGTTAADTVVIGPGLFAAPELGWQVTSDHPLTIRGSAGTVLDGGSAATPGIVLRGRSATIEKLTVELPVPSQVGIESRSGTVRDLAVLSSDIGNVGIDAYGATVDAVVVNMSQDKGTAVRARPAFYASSIRRSELTGAVAVTNHGGGDAHVSRGRLYGSVASRHGVITVTDSRMWLPDGAVGLSVNCSASKTATLVANHVTVTGGPGTTGAYSQCWFGGGKSSMSVRNSILATGLGLHRTETAGTATLVATSNVIPAGDAAFKDESLAPDGGMYRSGNLHGAAKFNSPYTLSLAKDAPGVDAAKPDQLTTDFDAMTKPRPKDGNGDGVAVADMGAMERQIP